MQHQGAYKHHEDDIGLQVRVPHHHHNDGQQHLARHHHKQLPVPEVQLLSQETASGRGMCDVLRGMYQGLEPEASKQPPVQRLHVPCVQRGSSLAQHKRAQQWNTQPPNMQPDVRHGLGAGTSTCSDWCLSLLAQVSHQKPPLGWYCPQAQETHFVGQEMYAVPPNNWHVEAI